MKVIQKAIAYLVISVVAAGLMVRDLWLYGELRGDALSVEPSGDAHAVWDHAAEFPALEPYRPDYSHQRVN